MHNLDENVPESFEFQIKGNVYVMDYPTTEQIAKFKEIEENSKEQLDFFYGFIKPKEAGAPDIRAALDKVNVKVLNRFNTMIKTEMTSEN